VAQIGQTATAGVLLPITHKRVGVAGMYAAGAEGGSFAPTREEDASPTMFGALGMPHSHWSPQPLLFSKPMWWPAGRPLSIQFQVMGNAGQVFQTDAQRWAGLTGGSGGAAGLDLNLPLSAAAPAGAGISGNTLAGPLELSLDAAPSGQAAVVNTNRALAKFANGSIFVGLLGKRVKAPWHRCIARGIGCGAIQAPHGPGELGHLLGM